MKGRSHRLVHRMNLTSPQSKHTILIKSHVCKTYVFKFNVLLVEVVYPFVKCTVICLISQITKPLSYLYCEFPVVMYIQFYTDMFARHWEEKKPWACSIQQLIVWHCV